MDNEMLLELRLEHLLRYLRALPTIRVHPELDERTLDIVQSLIEPSRTKPLCTHGRAQLNDV